MSNYPERWRTNHVPKLHNAMSDELCDSRTFNKLKRVQHDYDWHWWDGPCKDRDRSWKSRTKSRHQYKRRVSITIEPGYAVLGDDGGYIIPFPETCVYE